MSSLLVEEASIATVGMTPAHQQTPKGRATSSRLEIHPQEDFSPKSPDHGASSPCGLGFFHKHLAKLEESWTLEAAGLAVSAAALGATVAVLMTHDGKEAPNWGVVSLNAVTSALGTVARLASVYGATNAVSQLKWTWFISKASPLSDYSIFDDGSRGASGSLSLMWLLKAHHTASLGGLAIILSAAADPFTQNIVHYYPMGVPTVDDTARVSRADVYKAVGPREAYSVWSMDLSLKSAVLSTLYQPTNPQLTQPLFYCGSLEAGHQLCTVTLPGSLELEYDTAPEGKSVFLVTSAVQSPLKPLVIANVSAAEGPVFQAIQAVVRPEDVSTGIDPDVAGRGDVTPLTNSSRFMATECALSPCVLSLTVAVDGSVYAETVHDMWLNVTQPVPLGDLVLTPPWDEEKGMTPGQNFTVSKYVMQVLGRSGWPGNILVGTVQNNDGGQGLVFDGEGMEPMFFANFNESIHPLDPEDHFGCMARALAAAFTKAIRDAVVPQEGTPALHFGTTYVGATFVRVEWGWFAVPVAVWLLSVAVVLAAWWKNRGMLLWRQSAMPLLLLCRDMGDVESLGDVLAAEYIRRVEGRRVQLRVDGNGVRFAGARTDAEGG